MALIRRILLAIAHILLGIVLLAGAVCAVWSITTTALSEATSAGKGAIDSIVLSLEEASNQAVSSIMGSALSTLGGLAGSESGTDSEASGTIAGITGAQAGENTVADQLYALGTGGDTTSTSFSDAELGQLYQSWKDDISSPASRVFAGTGVDASFINTVASGGITAITAASGLDEASLTVIEQNASNLQRTARVHNISTALPADVQASMQTADASCQAFCSDVLTLVDDVRKVKAGNITVIGSITGTATDAQTQLQTIESSMIAAEAALGA